MKIAGLVLCCALMGRQASTAARSFATIEEAVAYARTVLTDDTRGQQCAVVVMAKTDDDATDVHVNVAFQINLGHRYGQIRPGGACVDVSVWPPDSWVRLSATGYHESARKIDARPGEMLIIDDIILERVTPENAAVITGLVRLEDQADAGGASVRIKETQVVADADGRFTIEGLGAGEVTVSAYVESYTGLHASIRLERGERRVLLLEGWRARSALVRWAYQPQASFDLGNGVESGWAIVDARGLWRISFREGFKQVERESDFGILQKKDRLIICNTDVGGGRPGIIGLPDITFDEVRWAPEVGYPDRDRELTEGAVYVLKCFDGEHYAKLEVMRIADNPRDHALMVSELARE